MRISQNLTQLAGQLGLTVPGRALVPVRRSRRGDGPPLISPPWEVRPLPPGVSAAIDVRDVSPRQMTDMSMDLYASGILSWDEYSDLAFQAELHPDFDRTIGALTGERAMPDRRRDYVIIWRERLDFELRYGISPKRIEMAQHIFNVFRQFSQPTDLVT